MHHLRSLNISGCGGALTCRVLNWLPPQLEDLTISATNLLRIPPGDAEEGLVAYASHRSSQAPSRVKKVTAQDMMHTPRFDFGYFLRHVAAASIEVLDLSGSNLKTSVDLVRFLAKTPELLELQLHSIDSWDAAIFDAISKLASSLCELSLRETNTSNGGLVRLGNGPCRSSLRLISLKDCSLIKELEGARLLLSSRFAGCHVIW